jgi:hypothetical protein
MAVPMVVEYLVIMPKRGSFCDSQEAFNKLLQADSAIVIKKKEIHYQNGFVCDYHTTTGEVSGKEQRYFQLRFTWAGGEDSPKEKVEEFSAFLRAVRGLVNRTDGQIETLWDDISVQYSRKAYPLISEIENLMRKLIANFMLISVGKEWVSETSPPEVEQAIQSSKRKDKDYVNVLHTVDFMHLATFLLKRYSKRPVEELYTKLKESSKFEELADLKTYVPQSNWQRYLSGLVSCEDGHLQKLWTDLYDLRCKVAHRPPKTENPMRRLDNRRPQRYGVRDRYRQPDRARDDHARALRQGSHAAVDLVRLEKPQDLE